MAVPAARRTRRRPGRGRRGGDGRDVVPAHARPAGLARRGASGWSRTWRTSRPCACPRDLDVPELLTGQVAVAAYDDARAARRRHRRPDPRASSTTSTPRRRRACARRDLARAGSRRSPCGRRPPRRSPARAAARRGLRRPCRMRRDDDGVWTRRGDASWSGRGAVPLEVDVYAPSTGRWRPTSSPTPTRCAHHGLGAVGRRRPRRPGARHRPGWRSLTQAGARAARGLDDLRAARPRLLDRRRDRAGGPARHVPRLQPARQRRHAAPARARRRRPEHRPPAAGVRHRHDRGAARRPAVTGVRPRVRSRRTRRSSRRASTAVAARDGFNWGYDPWHYTTPEGSYATDPDGPGRTLEFRRMVAGPQRRRAAGGDGRRLQPHDGVAARTAKSCSTASCPATTTGSRRPAPSRPRRAAPTPRPSTG